MNSATLQLPIRNGVLSAEFNNRTPTYPFSPSLFPFINNKSLYRIPDEESPESIIFSKPRPEAVAAFRDRFPELFKGKIHLGARCKYEVNFLNVGDLLVNWGILSSSIQVNLVKIIESDWDRANSAHLGIKKRLRERMGLPFAEHMILLAMMEVENMVHYGHRIISSNLIDTRGYRDPNRSGLSIIDPREAVRRIKEWKKWNRPQNLMDENVAIILLFPSPREIQFVGSDTWRSREKVNKFFRSVENKLRRWREKGYIKSYYASHEIGVGSILGSQFRPHTHAVIWLKNTDPSFLKRAVKKKSVKLIPKLHKEWSSLSKFLPYTMRVCRIAPLYRSEFPELGGTEEIVRFNTQAVHSLGKLIELWKHTHEGVKKRVSVSGVPTAIDGAAGES